MIQLIDASDMREQRRKSLGNKRYDIPESARNWIVHTYVDGHDHGKSVIVPDTAFMFRQVTTQQPLHEKIILDAAKLSDLLEALPKLKEDDKQVLKAAVIEAMQDGSERDYWWADTFAKTVRKDMAKPVGAPSIAKAIRDVFGIKDKSFPIVVDKKGNTVPDPDLKDTERIPWGMDFDEYMQKEVLPYAPETWIDESVKDSGPLQDGKVGVVGTGISFNNYFYYYEEPRKPEEIAKEIIDLEKSLGSFEEELLK